MDNTQKLLAAGAGVIAAGAAVLKLTSGEKAQDFLEAKPYWDQTNVPVNVYKNKSPFIGKVVSTKRIVGPKATGETCHIVIDHKGDFPVRYMHDYIIGRFSPTLIISLIHALQTSCHLVLGGSILGCHTSWCSREGWQTACCSSVLNCILSVW